MPEIISLSAEPRDRVGKGAARAMRRAGRVPAIVYGDKKDPVLISLEPREFGRALARPGFFAHLIDLKLDGTTHRTLPREVQYHPVTDAPLHVDFLRVGAGAQVTVAIPVVFINHERAPGLRRGGILNIVRHDIEMVCSVDNIPERIVVDPEILAGKPVIRGTRIAVELVLELLAADQSESVILANYPGLTREDILACLSYASYLAHEYKAYPIPA